MSHDPIDALKTYYDALAQEPMPARTEPAAPGGWMLPMAAALAAYAFLVIASRMPQPELTTVPMPPNWQVAALGPETPADRRQSLFLDRRRVFWWV